MKKSFGLGRKIYCGSVLVFALLMSACQPSALVSSLEAVIGAAEIAVPVIGSAAGLPPQVTGAIVSYLQLVDAATAQASTILAGGGTSAEKSAQIVALFSHLASGCNCLPPGTPQVVANVIDAVAQAVARFLGHFASNGILATTQPVSNIKVGKKDITALANIRHRAEQHAANLKDLKK